MNKLKTLEIAGQRIPRGERRDIDLSVSESFSGTPVKLPLMVWRAKEDGPTVLVSAAVHGDELNGTGVVRELILRPPFELASGSLVLVPVVNIMGFERQTRYLPDRRDLNRSFPGSPNGSMASRLAHTIFTQIVTRCDAVIDLHTAATRRTNFPNVRADLRARGVSRLAFAFGTELIVQGKGPVGSLRRSACLAGHPTIILEAGEVLKVEPAVGEVGLRGVRNVLIELGMVHGEPERPSYQARVNKTNWVRANCGGMLQFHVAPGDLIEKDQPIATNTNLLGREQGMLTSPTDGVVLGMTTAPGVKPGDPVCHVAIPVDGIEPIRCARRKIRGETLEGRLREELATNVTVSNPDDSGNLTESGRES